MRRSRTISTVRLTLGFPGASMNRMAGDAIEFRDSQTGRAMKTNIITLGSVGLALLCLQTIAFAQNTKPPAQPGQTGPSKRLHAWWRDAAPGLRTYTANNKQMPRISVKGNKFVDPSGKTVLFRGLSISDPDKLEMQGHWSKDHFVKVKDMGAKLVRIPVHPVAWRERTTAEYVKLLDLAVSWCTELEMYIIIDWHTIGNLVTEVFQDPMYDTTRQETYSFCAHHGPALRRPQHGGILRVVQ